MLPLRNKNRLRRLKSKGVIDRLFLEGEGLHSKNLFLRIIQDKDSSFLYAGVSVSKRNFKKAVDRNRIKRQLRVALKTESVFAFTGSLMLVYKGRQRPNTTDLIEETSLLFAKIIPV